MNEEGRSLNADEARVLGELLTVEFPGVSSLRAQLPHVRVVGHCHCGCATVDLAVDESAASPVQGMRSPIPAEAEVIDEQGEPIGGVIVFLKDGYLSMLEIYSHNDPIREWPSPDSLRVWLRSP